MKWQLVVFLLSTIAQASGQNYEHQLMKHLLAGYSDLEGARPSKNYSAMTACTLDFVLLKLDLFEKSNRLETVVWPKIGWQDDFLTWDPSIWGGVSELHIPVSKIWTPDLALFNSESGYSLLTGFVPTLPNEAIVYSTGSVIFIPQLNLRSICNATQPKGAHQSPFAKDLKKCALKFGSWTYSGKYLDVQVTSDKPDLTQYTENPCWKIAASSVVRQVLKYDCCPEPYVSIQMNLDLQRNKHCGTD